MTFLEQTKTGVLAHPYLFLIYGIDGVGKTYFASQAPDPIFLGTEDGTANLSVTRFPTPKTFADVTEMVTELITRNHPYKTLAIDSLDWLEPLVFAEVCAKAKVESIEKVGGGYGIGFNLAIKTWMGFIELLKQLRQKKGMHIILIAHSQVKTFNDPNQTEAYDRYSLKLNEKAGALFREWVDAVLFCSYKIFVVGEGKKAKGVSDGERYFFSQRTPAYDAKNRYGFDPEFPMSWNELIRQIEKSKPQSAEELTRQIREYMSSMADSEMKVKIESAISNQDPAQLSKILSKLQTIAVSA